MVDTLTRLGSTPQLEPRVQSKVDTLGTIKSHVESGVIATGIGYDELVLIMNDHVHVNTIVAESVG